MPGLRVTLAKARLQEEQPLCGQTPRCSQDADPPACSHSSCKGADWLSLPPRVCLLGVLALVISWGALGLELAVSVVSGRGKCDLVCLA